jgi:hypothetical protein
MVAFGDLAAAADLAGVDLSEADVDADDPRPLLEMLNAILGQASPDTPVAALPPEAAHTERLNDIGEFVAEVGWNVFEVDRFVEYQVPPNVVTVMEGRFDEDRLTEALGEPDDGVWQVGDPDGDLDLRDISAARPLGEPLWLSLVDDRLVVTRTAEDMEAVRDGGGDRGTLGDDADLKALADALDAEDVYSAQFYGGPLSADMARATPAQAEALCEESLPEAFSNVAAGIADDGDPMLILAYTHGDDDAAGANAEALEGLVEDGMSLQTREPWSEMFEVDSVETEGSLVVARLRFTDPSRTVIWRQLLQARDNLVTSC